MTLLVKVANNVADVLVSLWEDPIQGVKDLWAAIKDNIVSRFQGLFLFPGCWRWPPGVMGTRFAGTEKAAKDAAQLWYS